jgi:polyisoprenoid-binding protein YceI
MYKIILICLLTITGNAQNLVLDKGEINAHTGIFGDSNIDPSSNKIKSKLTIGSSLMTIRGDIELEAISLKSDNDDRDENMHELFDIKSFSKISFNIKNITKQNNKYLITGILDFHGIKKEILSTANILFRDNDLVLDGNMSISLTQFSIKPPSLLFFTVRDKINIDYRLNYNIR